MFSYIVFFDSLLGGKIDVADFAEHLIVRQNILTKIKTQLIYQQNMKYAPLTDQTEERLLLIAQRVTLVQHATVGSLY